MRTLAILLLLATNARAAIEYSVIDLGPDSAGYSVSSNGVTAGGNLFYDGAVHQLGSLGGGNTFGFGVNSSANVVGISKTASGETHAFLYNGTMHDLGTMGGTESAAYAINNQGQITGYTNATGQNHAYFYDGVIHDIGTLGESTSMGFAINSKGEITGVSGDPHTAARAFLYDGTMHDLGTLGGPVTYGTAINDAGHITGLSGFGGSTEYEGAAFFYDGIMHQIGGFGSVGRGINSRDQIVGWINFPDPSGIIFTHAFIYDSRGLIDLNAVLDPSLGWALSDALAINDAGQITGDGILNGSFHSYLLTPVPEPSTLILAALGLVIVWRMKKPAA